MTPNEAKAVVRNFLTANNLPFVKLSARTVGFTDLARGECLFVTVHGWKPNPLWNDLKALAKENGFCIQEG
jgi:hypothetical protein